jgi:hypothetical protein
VTVQSDIEKAAEIRGEISRASDRLRRVIRRLEKAGVEEHPHGEATRESPMVWHKHPFDDRKHEHDKAVLDKLFWEMEERE